METYLQFVDRWSKAILAVLALVTVFFVVQLGSLSNDSNPYLLSESHPARKSILDLQNEFTGTFDAAMIVVHHPDSVFNRSTLDAVYELTMSSRKLMLATEGDADYLKDLKERYGVASPAFAAAIDQIVAGGLEQNDYFAADRLIALGSPTTSLPRMARWSSPRA